jgi:hypothetical protein
VWAKFLKFFRFLPWTLLALLAAYLGLAGGWKDVTLGRIQRVAMETFLPPDVPGGVEVTSAKLYLLAGTEGQATKETFPGNERVYGEITLTGEDLTAFLEAWEFQTVSDPYTAGMCHDPAYGFRLYNGPNLVREISICWKCRTFRFQPWPFPATLAGFNVDSKQAQKLLAFCDQRLPYYRPPPKPAKVPAPPRGPESPH